MKHFRENFLTHRNYKYKFETIHVCLEQHRSTLPFSNNSFSQQSSPRAEQLSRDSRPLTVLPISTSIFEGSINHSTIMKPTFHPILRSPLFLRTRSPGRSLALDHEMRRFICLPPPSFVSRMNIQQVHRKAVCFAPTAERRKGHEENEDDRIRRGFHCRTEIEKPRIENTARFTSRVAIHQHTFT